jgi:Zn finger protein HypA/HybF involved in hydrogenase expression
MTERLSFVCRDCGLRVSPGSFRALCPECGGALDDQTTARWSTGD